MSDFSGLEVTEKTKTLKQVLPNIYKNAVDSVIYRRQCSDKQQYKGTINVRIKQEDCQNVVYVCDNGAGIENAIIDKMFDPCFSTCSTNSGAGMGLYMSRMIIERHFSGRIAIRNLENGAKASVRIPIKEH